MPTQPRGPDDDAEFLTSLPAPVGRSPSADIPLSELTPDGVLAYYVLTALLPDVADGRRRLVAASLATARLVEERRGDFAEPPQRHWGEPG